MRAIDRLYRVENYTIQKYPKIENELYIRLKKYEDVFDAKFSQLVNVCLEEFLAKKEKIYYYAKPEGEIAEYRGVMIRVQFYEELEKIKKNTGISIERQINLAIKNFLDEHESN